MTLSSLLALPDHRRGDALDHDVDAGRLSARQRAFDRARQVGRPFDELPVPAEGRDRLVVTGRQELAAVHARAAIFLELNLAFGVPAAVVAEHGDERQVPPHGGFEFGHVEPDRAVAEHGKYRRSGLEEPGRERERERAPDGAGNAIDETPAHRQHALAPLGKLPAVAHQYALVVSFDVGTQRAEHFGRVQAAGRWSSRARASASHWSSRVSTIAARAMSASAALLTSAMQPNSNRSPF